MTAVEAQIRHGDYFDMLLSTSLLLEEEFLIPIVRATTSVLGKAGMMARIKFDNRPIMLIPNAMEKRLAKQRYASQAAAAINVVTQVSIEIGKMPPDATMAIDVPKLIRYLLENMDFPK